MRLAGRFLVGFCLLLGVAGFLWLGPSIGESQIPVSLFALSATATSLFLQDVGRRVRILVVALAWTAGLSFQLTLKYNVGSIAPWLDAGYKVVIMVASVAAAFGLVRRVPWGRWVVLALGLGGLARGLMNLADLALSGRRHGFHTLVHYLDDEPMEIWRSYVLTVVAVALLSLAGGARMKRAFSQPVAPAEPTPRGGAAQPHRGAVRLGSVAAMAAILVVLFATGFPFMELAAVSLIAAVIPIWIAGGRSQRYGADLPCGGKP